MKTDSVPLIQDAQIPLSPAELEVSKTIMPPKFSLSYIRV